MNTIEVPINGHNSHNGHSALNGHTNGKINGNGNGNNYSPPSGSPFKNNFFNKLQNGSNDAEEL